jgi:hypothetical protein
VVVFGPLDLGLCPDLPERVAQRGLGQCRPAASAAANGPSVWLGKAGGRQVGIAYVTPSLQGPGTADAAETGDRLVEVLRNARPAPEFVLLVSRLGLEGDRRFLSRDETARAVNVVIEADEAVSASSPVEISGVPVVLPPRGGRHVGQLTVSLDGDRSQVLLAAHPITREAPIDPQVQEIAARFLSRSPAVPTGRVAPARTEWGFVSASRCAQCHPEQAAAWSGSAHARSVGTLRTEGRTEPACLRCHSEYFRRNQSYVQLPAGDDGVQCASCHGDGLAHSLTEDKTDILPSVPGSVCRDCHDGTRSPGFDLATYLQRCAH